MPKRNHQSLLRIWIPQSLWVQQVWARAEEAVFLVSSSGDSHGEASLGNHLGQETPLSHIFLLCKISVIRPIRAGEWKNKPARTGASQQRGRVPPPLTSPRAATAGLLFVCSWAGFCLPWRQVIPRRLTFLWTAWGKAVESPGGGVKA